MHTVAVAPLPHGERVCALRRRRAARTGARPPIGASLQDCDICNGWVSRAATTSTGCVCQQCLSFVAASATCDTSKIYPPRHVIIVSVKKFCVIAGILLLTARSSAHKHRHAAAPQQHTKDRRQSVRTAGGCGQECWQAASGADCVCRNSTCWSRR